MFVLVNLIFISIRKYQTIPHFKVFRPVIMGGGNRYPILYDSRGSPTDFGVCHDLGYRWLVLCKDKYSKWVST